MVAHIHTISDRKQEEDTPSQNDPADPPHRAWFLQADMPSCTKVDIGPHTVCGRIPSADHSSNSWDTQGFAEDARCSLSAGIWPPRAYPCSFCRREFRSAQALGGHMNVHRRDRARLRDSSPPLSSIHAPISLLQSQKYGANPSGQSPEEPLLALSASPIPVSISSILPTFAPCTSLTSTRHASNFAKSFPRLLHELASEAASSLMHLPQPSGSADLLYGLWPASITNCAKLSCQSRAIPAPPLKEKPLAESSPISSTVSSGRTSAVTELSPANCRRGPPPIEAEDESPKKKFQVGSSLLHYSQNSGSSSYNQDTQFSTIVNNDVEDTTCSNETAQVSGAIDLELRLSLRPP